MPQVADIVILKEDDHTNRKRWRVYHVFDNGKVGLRDEHGLERYALASQCVVVA